MLRTLIGAVVTFLAASGVTYAAPFVEPQVEHWAMDCVQRCLDAGIMRGYDGSFNGKRLLNRYQVAVVIARLLDACERGQARRTAERRELEGHIRRLEKRYLGIAGDIAALKTKVSRMQETLGRRN